MFYLVARSTPRSTLFPTRRSSDLIASHCLACSAGMIPLKAVFAHLTSTPIAFSGIIDRKSTRLNSSHLGISYAVVCLKKKRRIWRYRSEDVRRTIDRHQNTVEDVP